MRHIRECWIIQEVRFQLRGSAADYAPIYVKNEKTPDCNLFVEPQICLFHKRNIQFPFHFFTSSHHLKWQACLLLQSSGTRNQTSTSIALGVVHKLRVYPRHIHHSHLTWLLMGLSPFMSILTTFPTSKQPFVCLAFPHC